MFYRINNMTDMILKKIYDNWVLYHGSPPSILEERRHPVEGGYWYTIVVKLPNGKKQVVIGVGNYEDCRQKALLSLYELLEEKILTEHTDRYQHLKSFYNHNEDYQTQA